MCVVGDEVLVKASESQETSYVLGRSRSKPIVYKLQFVSDRANTVESDNVATKCDFGLGETALGLLGVEL